MHINAPRDDFCSGSSVSVSILIASGEVLILPNWSVKTCWCSAPWPHFGSGGAPPCHMSNCKSCNMLKKPIVCAPQNLHRRPLFTVETEISSKRHCWIKPSILDQTSACGKNNPCCLSRRTFFFFTTDSLSPVGGERKQLWLSSWQKKKKNGEKSKKGKTFPQGK